MSDDHLHLTRILLRAHEDGALEDRDLLDLYRAALVSACPACAAEDRLHRAERQLDEPIFSFYERLRSDLDASRDPEGDSVQERVARLLAAPRREWLGIIQEAMESYASPRIVVELLERARRLLPGAPQEVEAITEIIQHTALRLTGPDLDGFGHAATISALALRSCSLRVQDRLTEAKALVAMARLIVKRQRVTDALTLAELDLHEGALHRDIRDFPVAGELLSRAAWFYRLHNQHLDTYRALLLLADVERQSGRYREALHLLDAAQDCILPDPPEPATFRLDAQRALVLADAGSYSQARAVVSRIRERRLPAVGPGPQFRLRWTEGRIALGLDELEEAETALLDARAITRSMNDSVDTALVSLDLALVHLRAGRRQPLEEIAAFLQPLLGEEGFHEEAKAALGLLIDAIQRRELSQKLVRQLYVYLSQSRNDPRMKFSRS